MATRAAAWVAKSCKSVNYARSVEKKLSIMALLRVALVAHADLNAIICQMLQIVVGIGMACATAMPMGAHLADNLLAEVQGRPLVPFGFQYLFQGISLGRQSGTRVHSLRFIRNPEKLRHLQNS